MRFSTLMSYILQILVPFVNFDKNSKLKAPWASQYLDKLFSIKTHVMESFSEISLLMPIKITKMLQNVINNNVLRPNLILRVNYLQKCLVILNLFITIFQARCQKHSQHNIQIVEDNGTLISDCKK